MALDQSLYKVPADAYGSDYQEHLLEQYKLYVEMADKISERRQSANTYFLTINTALLAFLGIVVQQDTGKGTSPTHSVPWLWGILIAVAGLALCYSWYRLVRSYRDLNTAKFKVVHAIEGKLPVAPYDAEWESVGRAEDPKLYLPFSHIEIRIPWIFAALYVAFMVWNIGLGAAWWHS